VEHISLGVLYGALVLLIVCSAFFSSSETGMMSLNRYRLRHQARAGKRSARVTQKLLERPDRLLGVILLGNNFVNILASSLATVIAVRLLGEAGIPVVALLLTLVILVFAEVAPKTMAAMHPEPVAFRASYVLVVLLKLLYPLVWMVNGLSNGLLRLFGVTVHKADSQALSPEELRIAVTEAGALMPHRKRDMLLGILDLGSNVVDDIMVPRNEIVGIDLADDWDDILRQLRESEYTRLSVFDGDLQELRGVLHMRNMVTRMMRAEVARKDLLEAMDAPYYVPLKTPLNTQLVKFQKARRRIAMVVDEYGDIRGMVTMEDLLEEIVGEFTTDAGDDASRDIHPEPDGSYLVDGSATIREVNRAMGWDLPTLHARTINGLILETMEAIPSVGTCFLINGYPIEVLRQHQNTVRTVRISPRLGSVDSAEKQQD